MEYLRKQVPAGRSKGTVPPVDIACLEKTQAVQALVTWHNVQQSAALDTVA